VVKDDCLEVSQAQKPLTEKGIHRLVRIENDVFQGEHGIQDA
jgi:hypothetical protein